MIYFNMILDGHTEITDELEKAVNTSKLIKPSLHLKDGEVWLEGEYKAVTDLLNFVDSLGT